MCPILLNPDDIAHPERSLPTEQFFPGFVRSVGNNSIANFSKRTDDDEDSDGEAEGRRLGRRGGEDSDDELVDERAITGDDDELAPSRRATPPIPSVQQNPSRLVETHDRNLFISRIKNGESPVWRPRSAATTTFKLDTTTGTSPDNTTDTHAQTIADVELSVSPTSDVGMTVPPSEPSSPTFSTLHSGSFQPQEDPRTLFRPPTPVPPINTNFSRRSSMLSHLNPFALNFASPPRPSPLSDPFHAPPLQRAATFTVKTPTSPLVHESRRSGSPVDIPNQSGGITHRRMPSLPSFSPVSPTQTRRRSLHQPSPVPLVGSYEESILSLRMSLPPSKPLPFIAQIGVLALGPCKASLRCPNHITIPFNAVFYGGEGWTGAPSPYVGIVELPPLTTTSSASMANQTSHRSRRGTSSSLSGGYRIPPKGQVQIVIKNANKTGIKLFLVPYDLTDMPPGSRTFLRQKSYVVRPQPSTIAADSSASPSKSSSVFMDEPEDDSGQLRYLVQLNFCSPSKGRHYLFKTVRVVFANRTLDGKEKLRNEIIWAEPRWSTWRP